MEAIHDEQHNLTEELERLISRYAALLEEIARLRGLIKGLTKILTELREDYLKHLEDLLEDWKEGDERALEAIRRLSEQFFQRQAVIRARLQEVISQYEALENERMQLEHRIAEILGISDDD